MVSQGLLRTEEAIIAYDYAIENEANPATVEELQRKIGECNAQLQ